MRTILFSLLLALPFAPFVKADTAKGTGLDHAAMFNADGEFYIESILRHARLHYGQDVVMEVKDTSAPQSGKYRSYDIYSSGNGGEHLASLVYSRKPQTNWGSKGRDSRVGTIKHCEFRHELDERRHIASLAIGDNRKKDDKGNPTWYTLSIEKKGWLIHKYQYFAFFDTEDWREVTPETFARAVDLLLSSCLRPGDKAE